MIQVYVGAAYVAAVWLAMAVIAVYVMFTKSPYNKSK
jgi:hypothetical protein